MPEGQEVIQKTKETRTKNDRRRASVHIKNTRGGKRNLRNERTQLTGRAKTSSNQSVRTP